MRLLHLRRDQERFDELKQLLGDQGLGIIDNIEVVPIAVGSGSPRTKSAKGPKLDLDWESANWFQILFHQGRLMGWRGTGVPFSALSLGTRRLLQVLVCYVFDNSALMLIEHPEDGIHFGLARKLIHWLRGGSNQIQTILTSHSSDVLNVLRPEEVRLVSMSEGATHVRPLFPKELEAATRYIKEEGTLSDFLRITQEN